MNPKYERSIAIAEEIISLIFTCLRKSEDPKIDYNSHIRPVIAEHYIVPKAKEVVFSNAMGAIVQIELQEAGLAILYNEARDAMVLKIAGGILLLVASLDIKEAKHDVKTVF